MPDDKFSVFHQCNVKNLSDEKVHKIISQGKQKDYVYDIATESHDFNCGFPLIVHNTDSSVLNINTEKVIRDLQNLEDSFDLSNSNKNHELLRNKNKKW